MRSILTRTLCILSTALAVSASAQVAPAPQPATQVTLSTAVVNALGGQSGLLSTFLASGGKLELLSSTGAVIGTVGEGGVLNTPHA